MARNNGDRYVCDECGATLVYEKACNCPEGEKGHAEVCCGKQMQAQTAASTRKHAAGAHR